MVDAGRPGDPARANAGCEDERVPRELLPADECGVSRTVDFRDGRVEAELDVVLLPEAGRAKPRVVSGAAEQFLREGGALVRWVPLVAGHDDSPAMAERSERLGGAGAGEAGSRDQDGSRHAAWTACTS